MEEDYFLLHKLGDGEISAILKDEADTEDLVQDIFLKIWEERETVRKAHDRYVGFNKRKNSLPRCGRLLLYHIDFF